MIDDGPSRPPLRYHGGKWLLAPWIIENMPPHRIYCEPFGGGASVLLRKTPSYAEVYNDLSSEIVNVFRVLRNKAGALQDRLRLTPFARDEFEATYYEVLHDDVEEAARTIIRSFMGFGSAAFNRNHVTGFRANSNRSGSTPAKDWARYPAAIAAFCNRLQGVVIENRPAIDVISQQDSSETLFYVDPPYPHSTRGNARGVRQKYHHEMTDEDHYRLAKIMRSVSGMVMISGYACDLYDKELYPDWHRLTIDALADGARERTEVLWMNEAAVTARDAASRQKGFFDAEG